jgi:hypothetical protein
MASIDVFYNFSILEILMMHLKLLFVDFEIVAAVFILAFLIAIVPFKFAILFFNDKFLGENVM